ncbi:hypothetical protein ACLVWU_18005 [Bdellovibrio sp. HCB290]|uniref:hypothetical protein n=1 Tax=Bdellovibrio sp. HCB290 TaxID=3394356 RepID=UPI0039B377DC
MRNAILRVFTILFTMSFVYSPAFAAEPTRHSSEAKVEKEKQGSAAPSTVASDTTKAQDMNEAEAGGLVATKADFMKFFSEYKRLANGKILDTKFKAADAAYWKYLDNWDTCVNGQKAAAYACLSNLSPNIQDGVAAINSLMAVAGAAAVKDSCSSMGKAMGIAQAALTAYTAACGAAKGHCGWYCSASMKALPQLQQALSGDYKCQNDQDPSCAQSMSRYADLRATLLNLAKQELAPKDVQSIAGKTEICTSKYAQLLLSAGTGIYGVVNAIKQANSCEDASNADSSVAGSETTAEKCAVASNANLPECICLKNPMLEGCGSTAARASMNASEGGLSALSAGSTEAGKDGLSAADLAVGGGEPDLGGARSPSSSAGGVGAPVGGGGANLGGGSGFGGSGAAGEGKDAQKALDTNILGGSGGGGGGGAWGSGGDGDGDKSGYRSYLPGGAKDPLKMNGGATNASKEVTGQGGKSNWEKVRERYQDNRSSLLNN